MNLGGQALDSCSLLLHYAAQGDIKRIKIYSEKIKKKKNQTNQGKGGDAETKPKS